MEPNEVRKDKPNIHWHFPPAPTCLTKHDLFLMFILILLATCCFTNRSPYAEDIQFGSQVEKAQAA